MWKDDVVLAYLVYQVPGVVLFGDVILLLILKIGCIFLAGAISEDWSERKL